MKKFPIAIFLFILASALATCITSYQKSYARINEDLDKALAMTMMKMPCDVVSADTIKCYRDYITIAELKDTASIAMMTERHGDKQKTKLVAEANCDFVTVFMLSDQKASGALLFAGILWLMGSLWYMRRYKPELLVQGLSYGGIIYANDKFVNEKGELIHLTPMQHSLLEMFIKSEDHSLSKQDICDRLWPKKPDASDTLYTLIRRIKPVIETNSNLKIESDRGRSYTLTTK